MSILALPTEILRDILRDAVHAPFLLDTEWDYDPDQMIWQSWNVEDRPAVQQEWALSQQTRANIVVVCRTWREVAREFRFEAIDIPETMSTQALTNRVEMLRLRPGSESRTHGWWTKRIILHLGPTRSEDINNLYIALLESCHNLEILTFAPSNGDHHDAPLHTMSFTVTTHSRIIRNLANLIQKRFPHSFRRFDLEIVPYINYHLPDETTVIPGVTLLSLSIKLHTIRAPSPVSLNSITCLTIPSDLEWLNEWYLPCLRHLGLTRLGFYRDQVHLQSFFNRHEHTLRSLSVFSGFVVGLEDINLATLVSSAKNITSINVQDMYLQCFPLNTPLPGITHLLVLLYGAPDKRLLEVLQSAIFPDLQSLSLQDDVNKWRHESESNVLLHDIEDVQDVCAKKSIRFVDGRADQNFFFLG